MIAFILSAIGRKVLPYLIGGVVLIGVLTASYFYIKGKGYDQCKAEWNASITDLRNRVDDARDRATDSRVPDPFDTDQ